MPEDLHSPLPEVPGWRRIGLSQRDGERAMRAMWSAFEDERSIASVVEVSANVSTNRVYRLTLSDATNIFVKASTFGSYFLFREDHDRIARLVRALSTSKRFGNFLAKPLEQSSKVVTTYDGTVWAVAYEEVERRAQLPKILENPQIERLAHEIAAFHLECRDACAESAPTGRIPPASTSIKTDIIRLLDLGRDRLAARTLRLDHDQLDIVRRHAHQFLVALDDLGYDDMARIPVLVDWNLGNFSVDSPTAGQSTEGEFSLFSRWDYDWFRTEPPWLDFYFLSRVSSQTGDRTQFSYGMHTLQEPRFQRFLAAYQEINPMTERDIAFLRETYRFFILHYVIANGDLFFRHDLATKLRADAISVELPMIERADLSKLRARA